MSVENYLNLSGNGKWKNSDRNLSHYHCIQHISNGLTQTEAGLAR